MSRTLMIQGTSSSVGKSLLVSAFCRIYSRRGYKVAPFKAQNMALNSYVTPDGLEIGRAQAMQAMAAGIDSDVRMNPILLKPEGNTLSQVILDGKVWKRAAAGTYWRERSTLWPYVARALDSLRNDFDLVLIEGAGSPAEINLRPGDLVNMAVALYARAPVLLAGDIDRGGVFAALLGTLMLLADEERDLVKGLLINKFRGDISLLGDGLSMLEARTQGIPVLGVIPWIGDLSLAEEDSVSLSEGFRRSSSGRPVLRDGETDIAVIAFPHISNFDDLDALSLEAEVSVRFVRRAGDLGNPDAIILPGTKTTLADLAWMKSQGLVEPVIEFASRGKSVVGICGGFQMLCRTLSDPLGSEGGGEAEGLGLLRGETIFSSEKRTLRSRARTLPGPGPFSGAEGIKVEGYEVRMGRTTSPDPPSFVLDDGEGEGARNTAGNVWGTYLHGVFDLPQFRRRWLASLGKARFSGDGSALSDLRNRELDRLADGVEASVDMKRIDSIVGV